ncbi:MAG: zinc-ribbon domain-containing protein [Anaerolineae bacterium]
MWGNRQQTCTNCGKSMDAGARFCPHCGTATAAPGGHCPHCSAQVAANAKFCPNCGRELGGARAPDLRGSVWRKSSDEFAVRIEPTDLRGSMRKELEVQLGQQAVLLVDGRDEGGRKGPGRYTVDSLFERLLTLGVGVRVTALLMDGGLVSLDFALAKLFSRDSYELSGRCVFSVEVKNPVTFFANVMKSSQVVKVADLRNLLFDEVRDAVREVATQHNLADLAVVSLGMKDEAAVAVSQHLNEILAQTGLSFSGVRTIEFSHPRFEELRRRREDRALSGQEAAEDRATEAQETTDLRQQVRHFEERAQVWDDMRRALLSDKMAGVNSDEDYKDFLAKLNERQLIRQEQLDTLAEDFAGHKDDRIKGRAHAAYLAELERDYNRKQAELAWRTDFTLEQMAAALRTEQQRLADEGALNSTRWENDMSALVRGAKRADWDRVEGQKKGLFDRGQEKDAQTHRQEMDKAQALHRLELRAIETDADLTDAQKRAQSALSVTRLTLERQRIEHEEKMRQEDEESKRDKADAEWGVDILMKMKKGKLSLDEESRRIDRDDELTRASAAHQREIELRAQTRLDEAQRQAHEVATMKARAEMSAEALASIAGPEQAKVIADLKRTEAMKGMSEEQVLYLVAERSPQVAQALEERFKALAAQPKEREVEMRGMYDRMLADIQHDRAKDAELRARTEDRFHQMFGQALESQRSGMVEIARATSHGGNAGAPVVVMTPGGQPQVIQTGGPGGAQVSGATGEVQVCPRCRVKSPVGEKFCSNCGHNFYES